MRLTHSLLTLMMGGMLVSAGMPTDADALFDSPPLSDAQLAEARGGFDLPNGIKVDFGVLMRTSVDGATILETSLRVIGDTVKASVQSAVGAQLSGTNGTGKTTATIGPDGEAVATAGSTSTQAGNGEAGASAGAGTVVGSASRQAGVDVTIGGLHARADHGGAQISGPTISAHASVDGSTTLSLSGTAPVSIGKAAQVAADAAAANGAGSSASAGQTIVSMDDLGLSATTQLPQLLVRHEIGRQISSLVVNTGNGRMVDSQLMINLQLDNVQPLALGSIGYRVQSLGLDAAIWRATGG